MIATDLDGTFDWAITQEHRPEVCISGRTWREYDDVAKAIAGQMPVFIRGAGLYGDQQHAGEFKASMVSALGVSIFYEDDPVQADIIRRSNPNCQVVLRP